jgi:hypothetical protein
MFPRVTDVAYVKDYVLDIRFSDGTVAQLDFVHRILGRSGVIAPLQDMEFFKQVAVDREAGTLVWPNGVDFCPDVLYAEATGKSIEEMDTRLEVV